MTDRETLIAARKRVAAMKPGCAKAILLDDPVNNWDRGELVKQAVRDIERENANG